MSEPDLEIALPQNRLLAALPRDEYEHLRPNLEPVRLAKGRVLIEAGDPVRHAYFLFNGIVSLLSITQEGETIEVAMVGSEGVVGIPAALRRGNAPYRARVQISAEAVHISGDVLKREFKQGGELQDLLLNYTHALVTQIAQSAACAYFHTAEQRLARWLLLAHDRVDEDTFDLTHECISHIIGAPRSSVSETASVLQQAGLIRYSRGRIRILDRQGLEARSCECYGIIKAEIEGYLEA